MKPIGNEKIYTFSFLQTILIILFYFELSGRLDFTIVEPPKKLLMSFVATYFLSFCFCGFFKDVVSQSLIPYFQPKKRFFAFFNSAIQAKLCPFAIFNSAISPILKVQFAIFNSTFFSSKFIFFP